MTLERDDEVTAQLLSYMEQTADLVGVVDEQSRILYLNEAARKRLGVGDATGLTTADMFPAHVFARYYDEIRPTLIRIGTWSGVLPVISAAGEAVPMELTIVAQAGPGGEITGLVTHGREVAPVASATAHDELTGLPQRAILDDRLRVALARASRFNQRVGVVAIDLDSLKDVNDTFGHAAGDELLRVSARRMTRVVRDTDTVARVGGDEFVVVLDGVDDAEMVIGLTNRLRDAVCRPTLEPEGGEISVTASFGVAMGEGGDRPGELLQQADTAMYRAKALGGAQVTLFDDDAQLSLSTVADEFAVAVSHGLIRPHVQSVVDLRTGELVGYQGLARWEHPERGMLEAEGFIDLVANTPMAPVLDLAVLRRTAAVAARVARRGGRARSYGHLSRRLVGDAALEGYLTEIARDLVLEPSDLYVEIAHPLLNRSSRVLESALQALHEVGVKTVLSNVQGECEADEIVQHGFDEVRLARRLVHDAATDSARHRVLTATVALAHALDVAVIAVGVESKHEEAAMIDAGCDYAQGFLFGPVVPAGSAE